MKGFHVKKSAEDFGISIRDAVKMRVRYLLQIIDQWPDYLDNGGEVPTISLIDAIEEIFELRRYAQMSNKAQTPGAITDEMIERARDYPVDNLVEFVRGKAKAWCHEDRNPSLFHGTRNNIVVCPVCDKKFGSIDVLVDRDGMTFRDAVTTLA